jgi:stearoyl-CoA desaturase (Delta-9 desaturase)
MWYQGLSGLAWWQSLLVLLGLTHFTIVAVTVYLHRFSAHRALELHPALQHVFRLWLWLSTGMNTRAWTAIHRKHHAFCETVDDPHSPVVLGLGKVMREGAELYRAADTTETRARFGKGTPDDWMERNVYRHEQYGIVLMLLLDLLVFGVVGLAVWALQMVWIPFFAAGVINGMGHAVGYRNYEIPSAATNILPWGVLIGGEELHNNHHTFPNSAKLSTRPWEFDIGWMWITVFRVLGLASVAPQRTSVEHIPGKRIIDLDTAWAAINDRFEIMARYAEDVIAPLVEQERARAGSAGRKALARARRLLSRDVALIDATARLQLQQILGEHPALAAIYQARLDLQDVWQQRSRGMQEMLAALRQWCDHAEQSGIDSLEEFAAYLRSYSQGGAQAVS